MLEKFKIKCHWHDFDCEKGVLCTSCEHMPKEEDKPNYHKPRRRADTDGWGMPVCPSCQEPTYDEKRCIFCGQHIKVKEYPQKPLIVKWKGYKGVHVIGSIWVYQDDKFVLHGQCKKKLTPNELRKQLKTMPRLLTVLAENLKDNDKSCDTCAFYNEDRDNQPCCYCHDHSSWEGEDYDHQQKEI